MPQINKYEFNGQPVTAIFAHGQNMWIATKLGSRECMLYEVDIFEPRNIFFTIPIVADEIVEIYKVPDVRYMYLILKDSEYLVQRIREDRPTTSSYYRWCNRPTGLAEDPVGITHIIDDYDYYYYILIPGSLSGENAQLIKINYNL